MRRCYIAGPMRGIPEYNFPAFHSAAKELRARGWYVYSPAEMDTVFLAPEVVDPASYTVGAPVNDSRIYVRRDLHIIVNELHDGDAVILLPGWERSSGAMAEAAVAKWCELRVLSLEEALVVDCSCPNLQ